MGSDIVRGQTSLFTNGFRLAKFKVEGREDLPAYLSPQCQRGEVGLVMVHEHFGLNQSISIMADQFASKGFVTIVPDIYRTYVANSRQDAQKKMDGLDMAGAIADIEGTRKFLVNLGCKTVHIIGFCMGGAITIAACIQCQGFTKAFPFYGVPNGIEKMNLSGLKTKIYAYFGSQDKTKGVCDNQSALKVESLFLKAGKHFRMRMLCGGHGFMNEDIELGHSKAIAKMAFEEVVMEIKEQ